MDNHLESMKFASFVNPEDEAKKVYNDTLKRLTKQNEKNKTLFDDLVKAYNSLTALDPEADDYEDKLESLEEDARDLAEELEIHFTYQRKDGELRTYTPESLWEESSGCSYYQSAEYGYDYGWNI